LGKGRQNVLGKDYCKFVKRGESATRRHSSETRKELTSSNHQTHITKENTPNPGKKRNSSIGGVQGKLAPGKGTGGWRGGAWAEGVKEGCDKIAPAVGREDRKKA